MERYRHGIEFAKSFPYFWVLNGRSDATTHCHSCSQQAISLQENGNRKETMKMRTKGKEKRDGRPRKMPKEAFMLLIAFSCILFLAISWQHETSLLVIINVRVERCLFFLFSVIETRRHLTNMFFFTLMVNFLRTSLSSKTWQLRREEIQPCCLNQSINRHPMNKKWWWEGKARDRNRSENSLWRFISVHFSNTYPSFCETSLLYSLKCLSSTWVELQSDLENWSVSSASLHKTVSFVCRALSPSLF